MRRYHAPDKGGTRPEKGIYHHSQMRKKCGAVKRNRAAHEAKVQPDDLNLLIKAHLGKHLIF